MLRVLVLLLTKQLRVLFEKLMLSGVLYYFVR